MKSRNEKQSLDRRQFLKLVGVTSIAGTAAITMSGCSAKEQSQGRLPGGEVNFIKETTALVIGAGMAGNWAAYMLSKAGVDTIVVEKLPSWGGDAILACGVVYGRGTCVQAKYGIQDITPEQAWEQAKPRYEQSKYPELHEMIYYNTPRAFEIWDELGVEWMDMTAPNWTPFFHVQKDGLHNVHKLIQPLYEKAKQQGAEYLFETKAVSLIVDEENAVVGVRFKDEVSGENLDIKAKHIVMAMGDYVSNQDIISKYAPQASKVVIHTPNSMGEGLLMGEAVGAAFVNMGQIVALGPDYVPTTTVGLFDSILSVFPDGKRIGDESNYMEPLMKMGPAGYSHFWTIYDETILNGSMKGAYEERINMGGVITAASVEELAEKMLVPYETLKTTIDKFNADAENGGVDTEFNKRIGIKLLKAPFYGVKSTPVRYKAAGGLAVNEKLQVLDKADDPIKNLYAVGGTQGEASINIHQAASMGLHVADVIIEMQTA